MYVPFDHNEDTLKHNLLAWEAAYTLYEVTIQSNKAIFTYNINPTWGGLESALDELETHANIDDISTKHKKTTTHHEAYDLQADLPYP